MCKGRPSIKGSRITVQTILEFLAAGDSIEDILADYPGLEKEDILSALRYSSRLMANQFRLEA